MRMDDFGYGSHRVSRADVGGPGAFGALGWVEEDPAPGGASIGGDWKGNDPAAAVSSPTPLVLDRGEHPGSKDIDERVRDTAAARVPGLRESGGGGGGGGRGGDGGDGDGDGWGGGVGGGIDRLDSSSAGRRTLDAPVGGRSGGLAGVDSRNSSTHGGGVGGKVTFASPTSNSPAAGSRPPPPPPPGSGLGVLHSALSVPDDNDGGGDGDEGKYPYTFGFNTSGGQGSSFTRTARLLILLEDVSVSSHSPALSDERVSRNQPRV